jgi:uncharacterized protein (TIGR02246 family)
MPASKPEECDFLIAEYVNAGNLDAAADLYEDDAIFMGEPGKPTRGRAAIREMIQGMIAGGVKIGMQVDRVSQNGDIALTRSVYTVTSTGADGKQSQENGRGTEVVRRQADGTWRFLIDDPTGAI